MALTIRMKRSFSSSVMGQPQLSDGFHRLEQAIGVHPRDPESLRDLGRTLAIAVQGLHGLPVNAGFAALVDARLLRLRDALKLALAPEVRLKLRKHPEHVEKRLTRRRAGVDGLLGRPEMRTLRLHLAHDVLEVPNGAGEPVDARDHQFVARAQKRDDARQFGSALARGAGDLFRADDLAPSGLEALDLKREVLVGAADPSVADSGQVCNLRV